MFKHPLAVSKRPEGQATRGKTARNRLRRIDALIALYDPGLLRRTDGSFARAFCVDLGFGAEPHTTLESAACWRRLRGDLPLLGVEIDPARVAAAAPYADALTSFRLGGFNLPVRNLPAANSAAREPGGCLESVRLVRALNVLRQYDESEVESAYHLLARHVLPGGLLVEGTSDPFGRRWVVHLMRRVAANDRGRTWRREALVFGTNFRDDVEPVEMQAVLPKDLIHRVVPGEPIYDFFEAWKRAVAETRPFSVWGRRRQFAAVARRLAASGYALDIRRRFLKRGFLLWRPPIDLSSVS